MPGQTPIVEIRSENYRFLQEHVYSQAGLVFGEDKRYLFESRLAPIVKQLGLDSINDLCALLQATRETEVGRQVVEAMTTNEPYFFRDPGHYDAIRTCLAAQAEGNPAGYQEAELLVGRRIDRQEAYSLAMRLIEDGLADWNIQILGTDFSTPVLERARAGRYQQIEVNRGLPAALLVKHFMRSGVDWQLSEQVRRMARFETIDLRKSMRTLGPFDLVFCRNVMIYFDDETKKRILKEIHGTLFRGGWLLLGGAETAFGVDEWFERQIVGNAIVYVAR